MHETNLDYFQLDFVSQGFKPQDWYNSNPPPTNPSILRVLAGLRDYSPIASLLDNRLLQLKECLSLIRLKVILQRLKPLIYKYLMSEL